MNKEIDELIKLLSPTKTDEELTQILNIKFSKLFNREAIKKRRQRLGIKKARGKGVCIVLSIKNDNNKQ